MPIRAEMKALYPPFTVWREIRNEVLAHAENKCESCGVQNGLVGVRDLTGKFWTADDFNSGVCENVEFERDGDRLKQAFRVVLTIAHKDHDPTNNGEPGNRPNLAAWCQKCHLTHDAKEHAKNARVTRNKKKGQENLFGTPSHRSPA